MIKKIGLVALITLGIVSVSLLVVRFGFGGSEDTWLCQNGIWVKHGNPASQPPTKGCGEVAESTATPILVGGDKNEHGCIGSAGYTWCEIKTKCLRVWEEPCVNAP